MDEAEPAETELIAVLAAVTDGQPRCLTIDGSALPAGPFGSGHRSLQAGLRGWVERQTRHPLGYVEQLYTFADRGRTVTDRRTISISYLGLTREQTAGSGAVWANWFRFFPWEDHREGRPLDEVIEPALRDWASGGPKRQARERWQRAADCFGLDGHEWNEELVLQRYELLFEAGLVPEAGIGGGGAVGGGVAGERMRHDHRRILATGIARLRAKIKYRPVVFELMPAEFTLLQLQRCVEALAGRELHKPNFRRLIAQQALVEEAGPTIADTGGRPARLYRFRGDVLRERALAGARLPLARG